MKAGSGGSSAPRKSHSAWARSPGGASRRGGGVIERTYVLPNFRASLAFVAFVGELAEAKNHHPDIDIRYNQVTLRLSTHDAGGITAKDFELARLVDELRRDG